MPFQLKVEYSPIYELTTSLHLYLEKKAHRVTDLGKSWVKEADTKLQPGLKKKLTQMMEQSEEAFWDKKLFQYFLAKTTLDSPAKEEVDGFLDWLSGQSSEDLYMNVDWREQWGLSMDEWKSMHQLVVEVVDQWNQQYFRHIDPAILHVLKEDADRKQRLSERLDAVEVVEQATKGIRLQPINEVRTLILIPQYHYAPINLFEYGNPLTWKYAVDFPPQSSDDPPRSLVRFSSSLGDPNRLRILRFIAEEARSFMEIVHYVGLAKSTVNHHLVHLRAAGLVQLDYHPDKGTGLYRLREKALDQVGSELKAYLKSE
ncbi:ArsR/SmtB family transcription factor [Desmospora profundinema]|uniref:DNA-binding transcriptional ArsR family regulator n=1 Tax=Desmospora profundinema TaxID=1571184 RepID=A0ABU1IN78_9BACL|nr:winged helix-turn-helix domain-containing protein [Desmospora profundinema]MDR6225858.1 DNA-binding transcriptional ArsR family regulator [Desmospora profundinema]